MLFCSNIINILVYNNIAWSIALAYHIIYIIYKLYYCRRCGDHSETDAPVCGSVGDIRRHGMPKKIVYAWALDAPEKELPEGVGLRVGGDTDIQYLVLQLHYKQKSTGMASVLYSFI